MALHTVDRKPLYLFACEIKDKIMSEKENYDRKRNYVIQNNKKLTI